MFLRNFYLYLRAGNIPRSRYAESDAIPRATGRSSNEYEFFLSEGWKPSEFAARYRVGAYLLRSYEITAKISELAIYRSSGMWSLTRYPAVPRVEVVMNMNFFFLKAENLHSLPLYQRLRYDIVSFFTVFVNNNVF